MLLFLLYRAFPKKSTDFCRKTDIFETPPSTKPQSEIRSKFRIHSVGSPTQPELATCLCLGIVLRSSPRDFASQNLGHFWQSQKCVFIFPLSFFSLRRPRLNPNQQSVLSFRTHSENHPASFATQNLGHFGAKLQSALSVSQPLNKMLFSMIMISK